MEWIYAKQGTARYLRIGYWPRFGSIIVQWRDGSTTKIRNVSASTFTRLKESRSKTDFLRREFPYSDLPAPTAGAVK